MGELNIEIDRDRDRGIKKSILFLSQRDSYRYFRNFSIPINVKKKKKKKKKQAKKTKEVFHVSSVVIFS